MLHYCILPARPLRPTAARKSGPGWRGTASKAGIAAVILVGGKIQPSTVTAQSKLKFNDFPEPLHYRLRWVISAAIIGVRFPILNVYRP